MTYDSLLWGKASCSISEKNEIIPLIETIVLLAEKACRDGLLAIEDDIGGIDSQFIKKGIQFVVDGTDPEIVSNLLLTMIYSGGFTGVELLARMAAADGILCLQVGMRPEFIRKKLYAYLGEDFEMIPGRGSSLKSPDNSMTAGTVCEIAGTNTENVNDEVCRLKLNEILSANGRILSTEPVSSNEVESLSAVIESSDCGISTFINILRSQHSIITRPLLNGFKDYSSGIYNKIISEWIVFEDLAMCDNPAIQKILRETDTHEVAKAVKGASDAMRKKIFSNMSRRAGELLEEDVKYMGPVLLEDVENSQNKIINTARKLQECGEIIIPRPGEQRV